MRWNKIKHIKVGLFSYETLSTFKIESHNRWKLIKFHQKLWKFTSAYLFISYENSTNKLWCFTILTLQSMFTRGVLIFNVNSSQCIHFLFCSILHPLQCEYISIYMPTMLFFQKIAVWGIFLLEPEFLWKYNDQFIILWLKVIRESLFQSITLFIK